MSGMEAPALIALAVGSGAATAYGTMKSADALDSSRQAGLFAAQEQSAAQEFEARQIELQGKRFRNAAAGDEAARRTDLESSLETIQVMRAGRGLDLGSPTGRAIMESTTATGERNIMTAKGNYLLDAANADLSAELSRRKARASLIAGDYGASAADAQISATYASGIAKVAGIATSALKQPTYR